MVAIVLCMSCQMGEHENHVYRVQTAPRGVMGGAVCTCPGGCQPTPKVRAFLESVSKGLADIQPEPEMARGDAGDVFPFPT